MSRRSELAEPLRTVTIDQRDVGEGLRILDEGGASPDAALRRSRRYERGLERSSIQVVDESAFLAGEMRRRHRSDAEPATDRALGDRSLQRAARRGRVFRDGDHDGPCADGVSGGERAIQYEMRRQP